MLILIIFISPYNKHVNFYHIYFTYNKHVNFYDSNNKPQISFSDAVKYGGGLKITNPINHSLATKNIFGDPPANGDVIATYFK